MYSHKFQKDKGLKDEEIIKFSVYFSFNGDDL